MSLALPSLTLLFLLTPGLIFRRFYYTGEFSAQYFKASFSDLLVSTIFPSVLIHLIVYGCVMQWYILDTRTFGILISGTDDTKELQYALDDIYNLKLQVILYLILTSFLGAVLGFFWKYVVRTYKLDRRHRMFRFANRWHYLLSGEILDYPGFPGGADEVDLKYVDVLVETIEGSVLYSGIVKEYILNKEGGMDSMYLSEVKRRYLKHDDEVDDPYYYLPGEFFVIPFHEIKNLHITYYSVTGDQQTQNEVDNLPRSMIE